MPVQTDRQKLPEALVGALDDLDVSTLRSVRAYLIEKDTGKADAVASDYDCLVLDADATTKETLADAGAGRADAIVSTTDKDATNVMVCLLAEEFDVPVVTSVVHNPEHRNLFRQIRLNTIENPQQLIAGYLYRAVARPAIVDYMQVGDETEVFEITVTEDALLAGKTLTEAGNANQWPDGVLIVAIERERREEPLTPRGNTRVEANDLLTVYSSIGAEPELTDVFGPYEDQAV